MSDYNIDNHIEFIDKKIRELQAIIDDLEKSKKDVLKIKRSILSRKFIEYEENAKKTINFEELSEALNKFNHWSGNQSTNKGKRLAKVKEIPDLYNGFTESSIRWLIFNEQYNGFSICIRRLGKKVLIDLDAFEKWIDSPEAKTNTVTKNIKQFNREESGQKRIN